MTVKRSGPPLVLIAAGFLLVARVALAGEAWSLERLLDLVRQEEESTVAFTERRWIQYLTEPIVMEGRLSYAPPDRLTREILRPKPETMIVEGDLLTLQTNWKDPPVRVLLSDYPGLDALITALRSLLAGDAAKLEEVYRIDLEGGEADWTVALTPRPESLRVVVERVVLNGAAGEIHGIEVLEAGGDRSLVTIDRPT